MSNDANGDVHEREENKSEDREQAEARKTLSQLEHNGNITLPPKYITLCLHRKLPPNQFQAAVPPPTKANGSLHNWRNLYPDVLTLPAIITILGY